MKIGLIAMSGIRLCDAELLKLGLTLPGFVERSKAIASLPSLGLLTLAGMTPPEHDVSYLEIPDLCAAESLPGGFDLVAISSYSAQIDEAYALAQQYTALGIPCVIGGPHVTALPDEPGRYGAVAAVGEGESVWPMILADAAAGRLQPIYRADGEFDLRDAPMPAFHLLEIDKYNRLTVQTSRGCVHQCEFCAGSVLLTSRYKQKPAAHVLAEIDRIKALWPHPFIEFADDNTFVNKPYWHELLPEIRKRGIRWFTETDISIADDEPLLAVMHDAGCVEVLIGLESPVDAGLDHLELRRNWKRQRFPDYLDAIHRIQSHGIRVNGCFVLGLDHHGPEVFDQVIEFVRQAALFDVQITVQTPFPGTPLYGRLHEEGRLLHPEDWRQCTLFDVNFFPSHMSVAELEAGLRRLAVELYSDEFTAWRRKQFEGCLRQLKRKEYGDHVGTT